MFGHIFNMNKIDGTQIAKSIIANLATLSRPKKILAAVLAGDDSSTGSLQARASMSFLKQKEKVAKELGVDFRIYKLSADLKNDGLRKEVGRIARQGRVGGVIVQLPLPEGINRRYVLNAIPQTKDVDVLSEKAQAAFRSGKNPVLPPSVGVVEEITRIVNYELGIMNVAIVGLGFLVGKPISEWLKGNPSTGIRARCAELYLLDIGSDFSVLKNADIVISGVGSAGLIKPEMLKDDTTVIDFGYSVEAGNEEKGIRNKDKIRGDFDSDALKIENCKLKIRWYTPTPGGTGPILVAKLMENFYKLNLE